VFIQRKGGKAIKVLTGSANFSVRGLYVQANNVLVFDDPDTAGLYGAVFDQVWKDPSTKGFDASSLSRSPRRPGIWHSRKPSRRSPSPTVRVDYTRPEALDEARHSPDGSLHLQLARLHQTHQSIEPPIKAILLDRALLPVVPEGHQPARPHPALAVYLIVPTAVGRFYGVAALMSGSGTGRKCSSRRTANGSAGKARSIMSRRKSSRRRRGASPGSTRNRPMSW
jgi:hypothetical protein